MTEAKITILDPQLPENPTVSVNQGAATSSTKIDIVAPPVEVKHGPFPDSDVIVIQEHEEHTIQPGETITLELKNVEIEVDHLAG